MWMRNDLADRKWKWCEEIDFFTSEATNIWSSRTSELSSTVLQVLRCKIFLYIIHICIWSYIIYDYGPFFKVSIRVNKPQTAATAIVSDHCDRMRLDGGSDEGIQVVVPDERWSYWSWCWWWGLCLAILIVVFLQWCWWWWPWSCYSWCCDHYVGVVTNVTRRDWTTTIWSL